jgi:hypothetical protein
VAASVLCNAAALRQDDGIWKIVGDPTEGALLAAAAKVDLTAENLEPANPFVGEIPYDPEHTVAAAGIGRSLLRGLVPRRYHLAQVSRCSVPLLLGDDGRMEVEMLRPETLFLSSM